MPVGTLDVTTSEKVISRLKEAGIRFSIIERVSGVEDMPVTPLPTKFGLGAQVKIRVGRNDAEEFEGICRDALQLWEEEEVSARVSPRLRTWYERFFEPRLTAGKPADHKDDEAS